MSHFLNKKAKVEKMQSEIETKKFGLITVAFNNVDVVKYQIELLKKNFLDDFAHIIIDNSNLKSASEKIQKVCENENVSYVKLPKNPFSLSNSHGASLNWGCKNVLRRYQMDYVGFLDHDCFPIVPLHMEKQLNNQPLYGLYQERDDKWYLWPGFSFFSLKEFAVDEFDFMPNAWGDTGASNYEMIYSHYNKQELTFASYKLEEICREKGKETKQSSSVEYFDEDWIHMINASNWMKVSMDKKEDIVEEMIKKYL